MSAPALLMLATAFTAADAAPYFSSADTHAAVLHYQLGEYEQASQLLRRYLSHHAHARDAVQAEFLYALSLEQDGDSIQSAEHFDRLTKSYPLLAPYHAYHAAKAFLAADALEKALARAEAVPNDSPLAMDATLLRGDALRALSRWEEAAKLYTDYLDHNPNGIRLHEATFHLAEAREKLGQNAADLWMKLWVGAPLDWGARAEPHLDHPAQKATAAQWLTRANVLFDAMRNTESESAFASVLTAPGLDVETECTARFNRAQSVFKQRNRTRAAPLFAEASAACAKTQNEDLKAKSLYQLARCQYSKGDYEQASQTFIQMENSFPQHNYADDARLRAAEALAEIKEDDPRIEENLRALVERFPNGDMKQEALWRLAFRAWRRGTLPEALTWLEEGLKRIPREDIWYAEGRTYYWQGRVLDKLGKPDEATAAWERCIRTYPLSYYALSAFNRLRERAPSRISKLITELLERRPREDWKFANRPLFSELAFRRGVELARLGLGEDAKREFASVGIKAAGKTRIEDPDRREMLWLSALLLDRAGLWRLSHWIARHSLEDDWHREWPRGEAYKKWVLAYPRAFSNILSFSAHEAGYPEDLLFAVTREESAFDPVDESFANAIGLLQMIIPTAKRFAKKGETVSRETLRDPVYNVKVGIRWLEYLWEMFDHNPALAVAGHNAGDGAVTRWMHERPDLPLDEWIELIPYDETRNYTKRVVSSFFTYRWLAAVRSATDPVPKLGEALPTIRRPQDVRAGREKHPSAHSRSKSRSSR